MLSKSICDLISQISTKARKKNTYWWSATVGLTPICGADFCNIYLFAEFSFLSNSKRVCSKTKTVTAFVMLHCAERFHSRSSFICILKEPTYLHGAIMHSMRLLFLAVALKEMTPNPKTFLFFLLKRLLSFSATFSKLLINNVLRGGCICIFWN